MEEVEWSGVDEWSGAVWTVRRETVVAVGWLFVGCSVGWFVGSLVGCSVCWLVGWLVGCRVRLIVRAFGVGWSVGWLVGWSVG